MCGGPYRPIDGVHCEVNDNSGVVSKALVREMNRKCQRDRSVVRPYNNSVLRPNLEYLSRFTPIAPSFGTVKVRRNSPSLELHIEILVTCHELVRETSVTNTLRLLPRKTATSRDYAGRASSSFGFFFFFHRRRRRKRLKFMIYVCTSESNNRRRR